MANQNMLSDQRMRDLSSEELAQVQGGRTMESLALNFTKIEYEPIVFVGGWGSSSYQYAYEGTYS